MRLIDIYNRSFEDYKKKVLKSSESAKRRRDINRSKTAEDFLTITKYSCDIEKDWIENIEEGLVYIQKAVDEARQFIRTEGEVVRIEKVKKTSVESVKHLSRNSNLITRIPKKGQMIIPDKLYIVERLSDYAVYENRFLYLLLTYLNDFIYTRLEKIKEKITTYESEMLVNKEIILSRREIHYKLEFNDIYRNEPFLMDEYKHNATTGRIEMIYATVNALLNTPLMKEVSKTALLKPPIVKTNALRINPNLRAALGLYDYIMSYNKLGYEIIENKKTFNPFIDEMNKDMIEVIELTTFVSYKFGNEITNNLKIAFDEEQKRLDLSANEANKAEIRRMKKRVREMKLDYEQYIVLLENRNKQLEKENSEMNIIKKLNEQYIEDNEKLEEQIILLNNKIKELELLIKEQVEEIAFLNKKYFEDMIKAEKVHDAEQEKLVNKYETKIVNIKVEHQNEIKELIDNHNKLVIELKNDHSAKIVLLKLQFEEEKVELIKSHQLKVDNLNTKITEREAIIANLEAEIKGLIEANNDIIIEHEAIVVSIKVDNQIKIDLLNKKIKTLEDERNSIKGLHYALKQEHNLVNSNDQFTSKDGFKELKKIKQSFNSFFKNQWKLTKEGIRDKVKEDSLRIEQEEKLKQDNKDL